MGFAPSRKAARQLIRHRHIEVKQRKVDIPSYQVRPGEEVRVKQGSRELMLVQAPWSRRRVARRCRGSRWIASRSAAACSRSRSRSAIPLAAQEQLVVELYSK
jgi:small subunit ribosomal protein S4